MKVLVLAGGFATRLWPLSEYRAKPLLLVNGKTILAHLFDMLPVDQEVILLTNKKFSADFLTELKSIGREQNTEIFCEDSMTDSGKLGALGALSAVCKQKNIKENILVFAGDNLLPNLQIEDLVCAQDEAKIAVREVSGRDEARKFGVVEMKTDKKSADFLVQSFEEKPVQPKSNLVSTGFVSIGADLLPALHKFAAKSPDAFGAVFSEFLRQEISVSATKVDGKWFDVGSFETYLEAHETLQKEDLLLAQETEESGNTFSGKVFLGMGASVKNSTLRNVIVYPNTQIENCIISNSVIDTNCQLRGVDLNQKLIRTRTQLLF